jgi:hypothetical protein
MAELESSKLMNFDLNQLNEYFLQLGCSKFQANRRAKLIHKWDKKTELSQGIIYDDLRKIGMPHIEAFLIETNYWLEFDKVYPPTPYEAGLIAFIEGKSKKKYNEVVNNKTMMDYACNLLKHLN